MKTMLTIMGIILLFSSCEQQSRDTLENHSKLENSLKTINIYDLNPFDHIVWTDSSIYYYRTDRYGEIRYKNKIK